MSEIRIDQTGLPEVIAASDGSLTVTVPFSIKRHGICIFRPIMNTYSGST